MIGIAELSRGFVRATFFFQHTDELEVEHLLATGAMAEKPVALAEVERSHALWEEVAPRLRGMLARGDIDVRLAILRLIGQARRVEFLEPVLALLSDPDDVVRERALECVRELERSECVPRILLAAESEEDEYLRVELAEAVLEFGDARGIPILLEVMDAGDAEEAWRDAFDPPACRINPLRWLSSIDTRSGPTAHGGMSMGRTCSWSSNVGSTAVRSRSRAPRRVHRSPLRPSRSRALRCRC